MPKDEPQLAAALGSRICHDLASPLGAVMAGLDLLEMGGAGGGAAERALMRESLDGARASLEVMRLAFGQAGAGERRASGALRETLAAHLAARPRLALDWALEEGALARDEAQRLLLAALCALHALPRGGTLRIAREAGALILAAQGALGADAALWQGLAGRAPLPEPDPLRIEFHLLAHHLAARGAEIGVTQTPDCLTLRLAPSKAD